MSIDIEVTDRSDLGAIIDADATALDGQRLRFRSRETTLVGEVIEVYDDPSGVRRILIKQDSGLVKAIPLWTLG